MTQQYLPVHNIIQMPQISLKNVHRGKNCGVRKARIIFQEILRFSLIFLLCFVWLRYFLRPLWLVLLATTLLSGVIYAILFFLSKRRQDKLGLKMKEKEDAENMFFSLSCADKPMEFFAKLARKKHPDVTKRKDYVLIRHPDENVCTVLCADLTFDGLTVTKFMQLYGKVKKEKATKIVICCKFVADKQLFSLVRNFSEKFLFLDEFATYQQLYKAYDCFPDITHKLSGSKMTWRDFVAYSFNKKRTRGYLFSAIVLILSGLFVRVSIYYCFVASILVTFALFSQFNTIYNAKQSPQVL